MGTYSYQYQPGTFQDPLTPDSNDTYDWKTVQSGTRQKAKLLTASAGQPLPPITQALTTYTDLDGNLQVSGFKVDSSPKWFTLTSTQIAFAQGTTQGTTQGIPSGQMTIRLGTIAGKTTGKDRVVRVGSVLDVAMPGAGRTTEYFYQVGA